MRKLIIIALSVISISLFGQNYNYQAKVQGVDKSDFVKIGLSPEITSKLNSDFSDIRIYDSNRVEVPYIFFKERRVSERELFVEYEIIEKEHNKKFAYTRIVIHNPKKTKINNIVLRIKNADVRKQLKLNASNDRENWYVLKDNYYYNSIDNSDNTSEIRVLNFPWSDYEYYELLIGDYYDKPINILQAGFYNLVKENGKYSQLKINPYAIVDTLKETIISIPIQGNYVDKISFDINQPKYFHREAELFVNEVTTYKKRKSIRIKTLAYFNLVSNSSNVFTIDNLHADTIFIRIKNNDNPSLEIQDIKLYQLKKYLIAELQAANSYDLYFSDAKANKPKYDLRYFTDSIQSKLKIVECRNPEVIQKSKAKSKDGNFNLNDYWLWIIIIGVALLLAYMSYGMIKDNRTTKS